MLKIKGIEKLNKNQRFFVENFFDMTEKLYKRDEEVFKFALELQEKNAKEIFDMIAKIMLNYDINDTCMNLSSKDIRKLKKEFFKKIDSAFANEYKKENSTLTTTLLEVGESKYNYSAYLLGLGVNFNIKKISDTKLNEILKRTIKGETYSNRIYKNKDKIAKELKNEIKSFLNGETNCNDISKTLEKKFKVNKDNSSRLIADQIARVQDEINEQFFKDNPEFEDLLYCATLDNHTCSDCAELDGRTYKKSDDSRPSLPKHVRCRCTYILLPDKDYRPRKRINNITKEEIDYTTYKEWENNVKKEKKSAIIKDVIASIKDGSQPLKIEVGKQGKHILGHNNYIEGRSYLTISLEEAQELVNKYAGTGELEIDSNGNWKKREVIKTNKNIGVNVSMIDGSEIVTSNFKIHYSKKGTHIVPK